MQIQTPTILVEQTSTLIGGNDLTETSFSGFTSPTDKQKEMIALKLNCLKDKSIRCESHKRLFEPLFSWETGT